LGGLRVRDRTFAKRWSDIRGPEAEGGGFFLEDVGAGEAVREGMVLGGRDNDDDCFVTEIDSWRASGCDGSCNELDIDVGRDDGFERLAPGM
jgi:hypothetical protein